MEKLSQIGQLAYIVFATILYICLIISRIRQKKKQGESVNKDDALEVAAEVIDFVRTVEVGFNAISNGVGKAGDFKKDLVIGKIRES